MDIETIILIHTIVLGILAGCALGWVLILAGLISEIRNLRAMTMQNEFLIGELRRNNQSRIRKGQQK